MLSWLSITGPLLASVALLVGPGLLIAYVLRLRGLWMLGVAPPVSVSLIAVASVVSGWAGVPWGLAPVLVLTVIAGGAAFLWARFVGRRTHYERRTGRRLSTMLAVAIPAIVIGFVLARSMVAPEYFAQRYDNFFHLNAIQYVLDTANASPLWVGTMTSPEGLPFYPSGWHATVSLVTLVSGAPVVVANNAVILVVAALVWPVGVVLLSRTILGGSSITMVSTGVLSAASPAFPYLPLHYGVLYPLFLGLACLPAALALSYRVFRPGMVRQRINWGLLLTLVIPGIAVAHPGAFIGLLAATLPMVVGAFVMRVTRTPDVGRRAAWIAGLSAYLVAGVGILQLVRPPADQIYWPVIGSLPHAIGDVVSAAVYQYPLAHVLAATLIIGAYSVVRRPSYGRWLVLAMAVVGSVLYIIVAGSTIEALRTWLTAPWYNNTPRLASLWVVSVLPLGALGVTSFVRWLLRTITPVRRIVRRQPVVTLLIFAVALTATTQGSAIRQAAADIEYTYKMRSDAPIVTPDEFALLESLGDLVPASAVIAGDPWTGASFAYGLSGRKVLMPHLLMDESDAARTINTRLDSNGDSPAVCAALRQTGVRYVLDFDQGGDFMENEGDFSGLDGLTDSPYVEVVAEVGDARLFRIVSCGLTT